MNSASASHPEPVQPAAWPAASGDWPYPHWIAHRGAGALAPENTLAAFALGHAHGYRMFECDVRLSADGQPFLLHDDRLERTTDGQGEAVEWRWAELAGLDAGSWHSPRHAGERLPSLADVVEFCREHDCALNVELKPAPGDEARTGREVAARLGRSWTLALPPLLSSFSVAALAAAAGVAPQLPRGLLLEAFSDEGLGAARRLGCVALICEQRAWDVSTVRQARAAGFRLLAYTVDEDEEAARLLALGVDGLITDRINHFPASAGA
ncbi:glycerophosphodiester phosphodiesterase [Thauera aromatica]|nr:glycerophosphodiester phosphodiesterase [Thauera aromatica]MCK2125634.1 glycerophosphodiester phosphodiesterase [Thauera aromatica]